VQLFEIIKNFVNQIAAFSFAVSLVLLLLPMP